MLRLCSVNSVVCGSGPWTKNTPVFFHFLGLGSLLILLLLDFFFTSAVLGFVGVAGGSIAEGSFEALLVEGASLVSI